jgi:hypothetical protein
MVLTSLALILYGKEEKRFPNLLLLDEADASLHPSMSKQMIDSLQNVFVKKLGIKVILTTHSPSTVAIAPEESIYVMDKIEKRLKKSVKDDALKILTGGIPNLSIDYKSHRQIFVESPTDAIYYQTIYNKMNASNSLIRKLYFISAGYGKSNCDQVIDIVEKLQNAGNKTSYGIVDWDNKDTSRKNILIHGNKRRYSIENFIFDPIYLAILLIERKYGLLKSAILIEDTENQYDLISSTKAQSAIDFIIKQFESKCRGIVNDKSLVDCIYSDNVTLKIPNWYLSHNGHDLKNKMVEIFPPLQAIKDGGEYEIELSLIKIIAKVYPFVPKESIDLINKLSGIETIED